MKVGDFVLVQFETNQKQKFFNISCKPDGILQLVTEIKTLLANKYIKQFLAV